MVILAIGLIGVFTNCEDVFAFETNNLDPLELWKNNELIIDGTVVEVSKSNPFSDEFVRSYQIKVNQYFKGIHGFDLVYAQEPFSNKHFKTDERVLFYLYKDEYDAYQVHPSSLRTTEMCTARDLIEISPVLPNENPPISTPVLNKSFVDQCIPEYYDGNDPDEGVVTVYSAPLKQVKVGIESQNVQCQDSNKMLILKYNGSPACVTSETKTKLIERDWSKPIQISVSRLPGEVYIGPTDIPSANNQFALRFYSQLSENYKESNIFFSPSSIFTAFAIAYEGARDNTATEMQQVFGFEKDDSKRKTGFAEMQELLNPQDEEYVLNIANALWLAKGFEALPEYVTTVKTHYDSNVESVDFTSDKDGLEIINKWIDEKTNGKIEKIFEELDPQTKLAITNAIYFKGDWAEPFDKEKTTNGSFYINEKTMIQVPMMELKTTYLNTARYDNVQILELPYEGEKLSMLILLPNEVDGIKSLDESLLDGNLDEWKSHLQKSKVKVHMPKFKLETQYDIVPKLQDMGIHNAFGNADFSGISNSGLHIYKAVHKAFVDVNEEGTEAAAATGMAMLESGPIPFTVNHPFVFLIQDNDTGQILFMGRVMDPTK